MTMPPKTLALFALVGALYLGTGFVQSWNTALTIFNMGLISAIMALGVNIQWGYAGLFNVGIMGFTALGGLAAVIIAMPPSPGAWAPNGAWQILAALLLGAATVALAVALWARIAARRARILAVACVVILGVIVFRLLLDPAVARIEAINPALAGNIGGLGLPVILAWPVGGALAAGAAWLIGKTALGLRSDYLAIATLGVAEIIIFILKNEDWLARGVKNVVGLPRPVPYEIDLQQSAQFADFATSIGTNPVTASAITVKLMYAGLFLAVLVVLLFLAQRALHSPWGRMMRAIRDNETAAAAMGKDVKARHLQVFVLGSAVCGMAGAMMTTLDSQLVPSSYNPLRFTFLIWVMVIVGGSGNNLGAVLGGFLIWWLWIMVEPLGQVLFAGVTAGLSEGWLKDHLQDAAAHMRLLTMGLILLLVLRFSPRGLLPER